MPELNDVLVEMKKSHEKVLETHKDLTMLADRMAKVEAKAGHIPADYKEQAEKINTAIDGHESKLTALQGQFKKVEEILTKMNESGGTNEAETKRVEKEHSNAFGEFLRKSTFDGVKLSELQKKSLFVGSDPDGGYAVPRLMSSMVISAMREASPIRENCSSVSVTGDAFKALVDIGEFGAGWVTERETRSNTSTSKLEPLNISVHEMYAGPAVTQTMLDDANFNVESWVAQKIAEKFGDLEANAFLTGDGVGKPRGILTYTNGTAWRNIEQIVSGAAATVTADGLINLQNALKDKYSSNAKFYLRRQSIGAIRLLKSNDSQYIWQPGIQAGAPSTLLGSPVVPMAYMPALGAGALSIMYGDLKQAYLIVDRAGIRVLRDPYTQNPYIIFKTTARVGGDVINFEAVKIQRIAAS